MMTIRAVRVVLAVSIVALVALAGGCSAGDDDVSGAHVEVQPSLVSGDRTVLARVLGAGSEIHGVDVVLEREVNPDDWVPEFHLAFPISEGEEPTWALYGDPDWGVRLIALAADEWRPLEIPEGAVPGSYRLAIELDESTAYGALSIAE